MITAAGRARRRRTATGSIRLRHRNRPHVPHSPYPDLRIKYLALSIIPTGSISKRSTPLFAAGALIALGAAMLFVFGL